ncbi:MAG: hypothetical protein HDT28_05465 [Clostridiales bacterium]|nr:hypothetical protein [Clostridiales bacterium]
MKKTVKSLIIAASVAAIAGIGAVSFAAWNANVDTDVDVTGGATGNIAATVGFVVANAGDNATDLSLSGAIVPYDQSAGYAADGETEVQVWSVALGDYNVDAAAYKFTLDYKTGYTNPLDSSSSFYYSISDAAVTAAPADLTSWTALGSDITMTAPDAAGTVSGKYLNIVLDSSKMADMDITGIQFTLTLADAT